jgi:hypothetical protein
MAKRLLLLLSLVKLACYCTHNVCTRSRWLLLSFVCVSDYVFVCVCGCYSWVHVLPVIQGQPLVPYKDMHVYVLRVYVWMSAIVLLVLFAGFGNLPVRGRCCCFLLTGLCLFYSEVLLAATGLVAPTTITLLAWLHSHPRYNLYFRILVVDHVTQLGVSHSKEIRCIQ